MARAALTLSGLLFIIIVIGNVVIVAQEAVSGTWKADVRTEKGDKENPDKIHLSFTRRTENGRNQNGSSFAYSDLQGLTREQATQGSPFAETARIQAERGFTHNGFDVPVVRDGWGHRFALPWYMAARFDSEEAIRAQIDRYVYVRSLPKTPIDLTSVGEVIAVDGHGETRACKVELHRGNFRVLVDANGQRALYCGNEHTGWVGGDESSAESLLQRATDRAAAFAGANASSRRDSEVEGHSPLQM